MLILVCKERCIHWLEDLESRTAQMKEMLYVGFYVWYFIEWLIELGRYGKHSYYSNTFEREAYANEENLDYLKGRKMFAWWDYI